MIKNDYLIMSSWSYEIVNGEPIFSKPKEIKIPINDILKANDFEPIEEKETKNEMGTSFI
jgi:hypothetical protein